MASWTGPKYEAPRWQAVALVWTLGAAVAFAATWYGGKWWLG